MKPVWPQFSPRKPGELGPDGLKQTKQIPNLSVPVYSQQCFWTQLLEKDDTPQSRFETTALGTTISSSKLGDKPNATSYAAVLKPWMLGHFAVSG